MLSKELTVVPATDPCCNWSHSIGFLGSHDGTNWSHIIGFPSSDLHCFAALRTVITCRPASSWHAHPYVPHNTRIKIHYLLLQLSPTTKVALLVLLNLHSAERETGSKVPASCMSMHPWCRLGNAINYDRRVSITAEQTRSIGSSLFCQTSNVTNHNCNLYRNVILTCMAAAP